MNNIYIENNELFCTYLLEQCPEITRKYILEYSPSVIESQSRILLTRNNYIKQYLVSRCFNHNNPFKVQGIKGQLYLKNYELKINISKSIFEEHLYKTKKLLQLKKEEPKMSDFDILLIQGMPMLLLSLYGAKTNKIFGDVIEEDDTDYKRLYEAIYKLISEQTSHKYVLCHDKISELKKELYLIKRK